jgi:hypothetical protein
VASAWIVELFEAIEQVGTGLFLVRYISWAVRSVFSEEKKFSVAALSQTLPDRLML